MEKIRAIQETNKIINDRIDRIKKTLTEEQVSFFDSDLNSEKIYEGQNDETSYTICKISVGEKTGNIKEKEFKRIICLKGEIKIYIPLFDEEVFMSSPNSILIPPNTIYSIEVVNDCELMGIYKPRKKQERKNLIKESIYTKETK